MADQQPITNQPSRLTIRIDKMVYWFSRHWLATLNAIVGIYIGLPILAPILMNMGLTGPARLIYTAYSPMCHQMASRSFFLFGDQYAYPRDLAGANLTPIEAYMAEIPEFATASPDPTQWHTFLLPARQFLGNANMGYKLALCERDMMIYGFVLLGGLLYGLLRRYRTIKPLPVWAFIVFGMGPIALDGFSQLLSQYGVILAPLSFLNTIFPLRESTPFLRSLTGAIFGFSLVWLTYPHINTGMKRTEQDLERKLHELGEIQ